METYTSQEVKIILGYSEKTAISDIHFRNPGVLEKIDTNTWFFPDTSKLPSIIIQRRRNHKK